MDAILRQREAIALASADDERERTIVRERANLTVLGAIVMTLLLAQSAAAGLRDIHPHPQQMGPLSYDPVCIAGTFYLVTPDNPTSEEILVRDEAVQRIGAKVYRVPIVISWSQYSGQTPALWMGTAARMPALVAALDSTEIAGLGAMPHGEEYQIYVSDDRILLGASDLSGMRWGVMSLVDLMSETNGSMYVDRAYIRDWPDFPQRITTINASMRTQQQANFVNYVADLAYSSKMNEIEWNDPDAGTLSSPFYRSSAASFRNSLRDRGVRLCMSADRTGVYVPEPSWLEGIPQQGTKMRVVTSRLSEISAGFGLTVPNGGFETWSGSLPTGWQIYRPEYGAYISRDQVTRHSGTSSVRFALSSGAPSDLDLRRYSVYVGHNRYLHIKYWYKLSGFAGQMRAMLQSPEPVYGMLDMRFVDYSTPTTQDWTLKEFSLSSGYADSVIVFVGPILGTAGTMWIDDVSIEAGQIESIVRRTDTPMQVYKEPAHTLMIEGSDYQITDTSGTTYQQFVMAPRLTTLTGGRLANNDSVTVDWYCAVRYQAGRQTPCFSLTAPLLAYQSRIRTLDSLLHPDGFKIHINEICYSDYDPLCTSRGLSPGQLVGSYCQQLYNSIQSFRPDASVRIYGDAFDIWVADPRLHPISTPPWTIGSLQQLATPVQIMGMTDYSTNLDSSFSYFQANAHSSVVASYGISGFARCVDGAIVARRHRDTCNGMQFYDWDSTMYDLVPDYADLAWNLGPYIVHTPVVFTSHPSSVVVQAEMWADLFRASIPPTLTARTLRYRLLPSGSWTSLTLNSVSPETYAATVSLGSPSVTGLEYYLEVTDSRGQTRRAPSGAPTETFVALFPPGAGPDRVPGYEEIPYAVTTVFGYPQLEWEVRDGVDWYEVHVGEHPEFIENSPTLVVRQQPLCPRYLMVNTPMRRVNLDNVHVYAVRDIASNPARKMTRRIE